MNPPFLIPLALFAATSTSFAQTSFIGQIAGPDGEVPNTLIIDHQGNRLLSGVFDATVDFDLGAGTFSLTSAGGPNGYNGFVAKYDPAGTLLWVKQFEVLIAKIDVDQDDNIYVGGDFEGTADVDPTAAVINLASAGGSDAFLLKLDASGNFISAFRVGATGNEVVIDLATDDLAHVFVTGHFQNVVDFDPSLSIYDVIPTDAGTPNETNTSFIAQYDYNGALVWAENVAATSSLFVNKGEAGNEYFLLGSDGVASPITTHDLDPGPAYLQPVPSPFPSANYDAICRFDAAGALQWAHVERAFYNGLPDYGNVIYKVAADAADNVFVTGAYTDPFTLFAGNQVSLVPFGGVYHDAFLWKFDPSGDLLWQKRIGSANSWDWAYDLALDDAGNVHVAGSFENTGEFNEGGISATLTSAGDYDGFVVGYDGNGTFLYDGRIGGVGRDACWRIADTASGLCMAGIFANTADCDPFAPVSNLTSAGYQDICIVEYSPVITTTVGSSSVIDAGSIAFPNPASDNLSFSGPVRTGKVEVTDMTGRIKFLGSAKDGVDVSTWSEGVYFVKAEGRVLQLVVAH